MSVPYVPYPQVGARLLLAAEARGAAPPVDDLQKGEDQGEGVAAGEIIVRMRGRVEGLRSVTLHDSSGAEVARAPVTAAPTGRADPLAPVQARFSGIAADPGIVYYATTEHAGQSYISSPFQLTADRGAAAGMWVLPQLVFSFEMQGILDDKYMGFTGRFTVQKLVVPAARRRRGRGADSAANGLSRRRAPRRRAAGSRSSRRWLHPQAPRSPRKLRVSRRLFPRGRRRRHRFPDAAAVWRLWLAVDSPRYSGDAGASAGGGKRADRRRRREALLCVREHHDLAGQEHGHDAHWTA